MEARNVLGLDFEFVEFPGLNTDNLMATRFALSMGSSRNLKRKVMDSGSDSFNIAHSYEDIQRLFAVLEQTPGRQGIIASAKNQLMVANTATTPAASKWIAAMDSLAGGVTAYDKVAAELAAGLELMDNQLGDKMALTGYTHVTGSYISTADAPYIEMHTTGHVGQVDLWNPMDPNIGGSVTQIANTLGVSGDRDGAGFEANMMPDVRAAAEAGGYSDTRGIKWGGSAGLRRGYTGLEDLMLMTGGEEAHRQFVEERAGGRFSVTSGHGALAHGSTYDAIISESIYTKLEAGLSKDELVRGRQLVVENRAAHAMSMLTMDETTRPAPAEQEINRAAASDGPGQSTGSTSKSRANVMRLNTDYADYGKKFKTSDYANSLRKSRAGKYMSGKWGYVAGVAASGLLLGIAADEAFRNGQRRQMAANHISSEKLSQAMSLGGSR